MVIEGLVELSAFAAAIAVFKSAVEAAFGFAAF
jgi:hypothetical protein